MATDTNRHPGATSVVLCRQPRSQTTDEMPTDGSRRTRPTLSQRHRARPGSTTASACYKSPRDARPPATLSKALRARLLAPSQSHLLALGQPDPLARSPMPTLAMTSTTTTTKPKPKRSRPRAVRLVSILILLVAVLAVLGTVPLASAQDVDTDVAPDVNAQFEQDQQNVDLAPELDAQAATGDQCAARCAMEDTNCIARCHGVPSGGNDVALNTGRCVSNCQVTHPVDPAAQSACFSRCQAAFVDPVQSSVPPAPTPEPAPTTTTTNGTPSPSTPASEPTVTATPGTSQESTTSTTAPAPPATPTSSVSEPAQTSTGTAPATTSTATTTTTRSATSGIMTTKAIPKTMATPPVDSNAQAAVLARGAPFAAAVVAAVAGML